MSHDRNLLFVDPSQRRAQALTPCLTRDSPAGGDSELEAAWIEVRRLRRLTDMLMSRLAELQHIGGGGDSESDYGYPSSERDFTEREYRPSSHLPHSHLQRSSTYPPPAPSSSSDGSVMSYEGSSSYPTSQRTTGYSHNSHYDYRSQDDGSALFPGFPGGLPFAPPGVGGGPSPPTTTVSSHVAPTAAQQTASQPGDIFVSDGTDYMMQQQRFY